MTREVPPRVFTIPPGAPFLATLADALLEGRLIADFPDDADPLSLAEATILLPTRRAARALAALLAERCGSPSVLLPRIVALGEVDPAETELGGDAEPFCGAGAEAGLAPAMSETRRRLIMTRLVLDWARSVDRAILRLGPDEPLLVPASPADALALSGDLARLMDALTVEDVAWDKLAGIVEERYDRYFAITLEFLNVAAQSWPAILAERGALDPARRRNALLLAEAERLARERPPAPMIAAGSTGSMPATARLLAAISRLPRGAVVLPGLDQGLDEAGWRAIARGDENDAPAFGHPQAALARLLPVLGITREEVIPLGRPPAPARQRTRFIGEALRPAATTDLWSSCAIRRDPGALAQSFDGLVLIEAANEREEALAAAVAIRETLETPAATVALVTPDRGLAERVGAELLRWGIEVADSAGTPLPRTLPGSLARLVAEAAAGRFAPRPLIALLAHPFATFGWPRARAERAAIALEIGLLRAPEPPAGLAGLRSVVSQRRAAAGERRAGAALRRLSEGDWHCVNHLIERLDTAFADFAPDPDASVDLIAWAGRHREALARVAPPAPGEPERLFADPAGEALAALFDDIAAAGEESIVGRFADYPFFFAELAGEHVVRGSGSDQRRVRIWGLLEARLIAADRLVLGGLDEGVWPPAARTDAFLNRPMRAALGLTPPERRIGLTAHDFVQALGTHRVVITRARKRDGAPTVASRFLQRMRALAGEDAWQAPRRAGQRYLDLAALLDRPEPAAPLPRPAPKPPRDLVPLSLSVTEIETLVRDPYAIHARHVLRLEPVDEIAVPPGAADRGTLIHEIFGTFAQTYPQALPGAPLRSLVEIGKGIFARLEAYPDIVALWWPRFLRLAEAFVGWEEERRPGLARVHAEVPGALAIALPGGETFTLRARADRIEEHLDGSFTIVDFKTGTPPGAAEVVVGFAPQLTLEAAMLARGAFRDLPASRAPAALLYVHASGGVVPLKSCPIEPPNGETRTMPVIVEEHFRRLTRLIGGYRAGEAGFMSRPFPKFASRFSPYDHLARVAEWSRSGVEGDEAESP